MLKWLSNKAKINLYDTMIRIIEKDEKSLLTDHLKPNFVFFQNLTYNKWRHSCVYTCKMCNHSSKHHADIYSHMISKHEMSLREYSEKVRPT